MADTTKKYFTDASLETLVSNVKSYADQAASSAVADKAPASHTHDDRYYTESEIDTKLSAVNTSITNITNGSTPVEEAKHAESADEATHAETATSATTADTANAVAWGSVTGKPSTFTPSTHNHDDRYYTESEIDTKLSGKSDSTHNHDTKYDAIGAAADAEEAANAYTDQKTANLITTSAVDTKISTHNTSTTAHSDIRDLISALSTKVNNFLDVDDTTTDQLSEVLAMIEANEGTIESLTSGKINVSDIVDNLTTNNASKVLSAKQGVALKGLIDALQTAVDGKAASDHDHAISDVSGLQSALDGKAASSHGTHVTYSTTAPVMDGTAAVGTATTVARSDHKHPTDTSRASKTEFDTHVADTTKHITSTERTNWNAAKTHADSAHAPSNAQANVIESIKVNGTAQTITSKAVNITVPTKASDIGAAPSSHGHAISDITDLQTALTNAATGIQNNTSSISGHTTRIEALETKVGDGFSEITSAEIQALFA